MFEGLNVQSEYQFTIQRDCAAAIYLKYHASFDVSLKAKTFQISLGIEIHAESNKIFKASTRFKLFSGLKLQSS